MLPTLWFRNTWDWGVQHPKPVLRLDNGDLLAEHERAGVYRLAASAGPDGTAPQPLFCDNETNTARLFGVPSSTRYPKDGINDHVVSGAADREPGPDRHQGGLVVPGRRSSRARPCELRLRLYVARPPVPSRTPAGRVRRSTPRWPPAPPRPTSSTPG